MATRPPPVPIDPRSAGIADAALRIRITPLGLSFIAMALVLGVAAANTGNNNLYMALAQMLAALVVSGIVSRKNLRSLSFELAAEGEIVAGEPAPFRLAVRNRARWLPNILTLVYVRGMRHPYVLPFLRGRGEHTQSLPLTFEQRGWTDVDRLMVMTRFPFGFFRKERRHKLAARVLVYPRAIPFHGDAGGTGWGTGEESRERRGRGNDLVRLRDYARGDDLRDIHWKNTAKSGRLILRERQTDDSRRVLVVLDNRAPVPPETPARFTAAFEDAVSRAAGAALHFLASDCLVALSTRDLDLPYGSGAAHRESILRVLAETAPSAAAPLHADVAAGAAEVWEFRP